MYTIVITCEIIAAVLLVSTIIGYIALREMDRAEDAS